MGNIYHHFVSRKNRSSVSVVDIKKGTRLLVGQLEGQLSEDLILFNAIAGHGFETQKSSNAIYNPCYNLRSSNFLIFTYKCFGSTRSQVRILSPRLLKTKSYQRVSQLAFLLLTVSYCERVALGVAHTKYFDLLCVYFYIYKERI